MYTIRHYLNSEGRNYFLDWQRKLRDDMAKMTIERRLIRAGHGNLGDHKYCRDDVWELRVDIGAGYRLYYALNGEEIILLLCGGDKRTQDADITRASSYWQDWQRRN
jgi:putative addiction module killer protein